jgi:hypothetical protein
MLDDEIWVDFKHCDAYMISSHGRFKSKDRTVHYSDGRVYQYKGCIIKPYKHNTGYLWTRTKINGNVSRFPIHREVARHYLPTWDENLVVDHIDADVYNNHYRNLQMLSRVDNVLKGIYFDGNRSNVKLSYALACEIRKLAEGGDNVSDLAKKYNVSWPTIRSILKFKTYRPEIYENSAWIEVDSNNVRITE